ncbi:isopenicillin N synthase family dioxygenase [Nocardia huaxiensis]|uniref:Isopenicillin N synthase family oxygenase n=1 Tax=Nocardia huaxiensis TaxID=2755382 RepID=A0A7D6Z8Q5_9NOCA|nr:isopenicillin N synthase family oxygenase [Nocardia huaxiensis]QLY29748.1 isopenicillin N synthase family oxygenase [Nocardia huaxiensis]UFS96666.1 isopenicillin N synthase family oxygenase [Nocardia huaxiensis]
MNAIATVDLDRWRAGGADATRMLLEVDAGMQRAGFLLVRGHGVPEGLPGAVRAAVRRFFALPEAVKRRYAVSVGGRGWIGPGMEANGYAEGTETPPDLKETFAVGADTPTGDKAVDEVWFLENVWPVEVAELHELLTAYTGHMRSLSDELLALFAAALALPHNPFEGLTSNPTWTCNINWYPPLTAVGPPEPGQFRIGPHTDFGTVTVLDREPGAGGLQVYTEEGGWADAPYDPSALTVNIGDLLAHWSGQRWPAGRHRVLPPQASAPDEDLVSLIYFYELDHDAVVTPLRPPIGRIGGLEPVVSAAFLRTRLDAITLG